MELTNRGLPTKKKALKIPVIEKSLRLEHFWKILWLKKINNGNKKVENPHNMELAKSALSKKKKALKKLQWSMKSPRLEHFWKIFW